MSPLYDQQTLGLEMRQFDKFVLVKLIYHYIILYSVTHHWLKETYFSTFKIISNEII